MATPLKFRPPVIAHRGASGYAPENTMAAFTKAAQLGIQWIEFDVMEDAEGELIIFHDETLDRTTNGKGDISHHTYPYLCSLDAGSWFDSKFAGEKIPTLKHMINFLENTRLSANIEIKALPGHDKRVVKRVMEEMKDYLAAGHADILFSSFSLDALIALRESSPDISIGLLIDNWGTDWEKICRDLNCISLNVNHAIITEKEASHIKEKGLNLLCYTVNYPLRALQLFAWGADAVFTDVPDKILNTIAGR